MMKPLLQVNNLHTHFKLKRKAVSVVSDVSIHVNRGEIVALVGESGCGKTMTSLSIMRLLPSPGGEIAHGEIWLEDRNLLSLHENDMYQIRGKEISMIFQEPMTSLNPVLTIGVQLGEMLRLHKGMKGKDARVEVIELLKSFGFARPEKLLDEYPHRLSGVMRQRVMIAMAMSCRPKLLIADEPTTALDVTIQAQILVLMRELIDRYDTSILLITHNLAVVSEMANRVYVMYAGQVVEEANVEDLFMEPLHPYTQGLIASIPSLEDDVERLTTVNGNVPAPDNLPIGCRFAPRCHLAHDKCTHSPPLIRINESRAVRCFLYNQSKEGAVE
jgi:peptide/nickel transport system ATP-binding protein